MYISSLVAPRINSSGQTILLTETAKESRGAETGVDGAQRDGDSGAQVSSSESLNEDKADDA